MTIENIKPASNWTNKVFFGVRKSDKANIYLSAPKWDCGWYWGFGYLGNRNEHYHLSGYQNESHCFTTGKGEFKHFTEKRNKSMYDCLLDDYDLNPDIKSKLWLFCELVQSAYTLKETAEVLGRGGSHYTNNPCKDTITNLDEVKRINDVVLPAIFNEIKVLLSRNVEKLYTKLAETYSLGFMTEAIKFMIKNNIHTDELKDVNGLTKDDKRKLHSAYWREYHSNKNK